MSDSPELVDLRNDSVKIEYLTRVLRSTSSFSTSMILAFLLCLFHSCPSREAVGCWTKNFFMELPFLYGVVY